MYIYVCVCACWAHIEHTFIPTNIHAHKHTNIHKYTYVRIRIAFAQCCDPLPRQWEKARVHGLLQATFQRVNTPMMPTDTYTYSWVCAVSNAKRSKRAGSSHRT